jgi:hypothetical protein
MSDFMSIIFYYLSIISYISFFYFEVFPDHAFHITGKLYGFHGHNLFCVNNTDNINVHIRTPEDVL